MNLVEDQKNKQTNDSLIIFWNQKHEIIFSIQVQEKKNDFTRPSLHGKPSSSESAAESDVNKAIRSKGFVNGSDGFECLVHMYDSLTCLFLQSLSEVLASN